MICWVCNHDEATTGEHIIKASDVSLLYPELSIERPAFVRAEGDPPRKIFSKKNSNLKFEKSLCPKCNNELTQPHDVARDRFVRVLLEETQRSAFGGIRAATLFPRDSQRALIDTQLFLAKLFGCTIVAEDVPFETGALARYIRNDDAVPDLWIAAFISTSTTFDDVVAASLSENVRNEIGPGIAAIDDLGTVSSLGECINDATQCPSAIATTNLETGAVDLDTLIYYTVDTSRTVVTTETHRIDQTYQIANVDYIFADGFDGQ